jgi:hypothetical protein
MSLVKKAAFLSVFTMVTLVMTVGISSCRNITAETSGSSSSASYSSRFASGTKGIKIVTHDTTGGSFAVPAATPTITPIPSNFPGYDGVSTYIPGVSPATYYDLDGTTSIAKPSWLIDFQMGISATNASGECAGFGSGLNPLDPANFYRVSEFDCDSTSCNGGSCDGTGGGSDPVFFRIILDRDNTLIGSAENLMIQVEYQASGLHLNSDGTGATAEDNLDQLWKIHWNSSLAATATPKSFGVFVPPNYSACLSSGSSNTGAPGSCPDGVPNTYRGSPIKVRQFIVPLSAYPDLKVIQFSRIKSRITAAGLDNYVADFCDSNEPLCLGLIVRSVTITRM